MKLEISLKGEAPRKSEVLIGEGLAGDVPRVIRTSLGRRTPYWIWDRNVWALWGEQAEKWGWPAPSSGRVVLFEASESNKRLYRLEELARQLAIAGADRQSALVAVGGGVTGDVVGFLASIYMRGIPHFQVPTTLLAQVDSSIGGKTGVDLPEGKNLLGTFHQPRCIWMSPAFLETLPDVEFRQGMAEVIKTAMIGNEVLWKYIESHAAEIRSRKSEALQWIISACCTVKAKIVEADEKEGGLRRVLNLGHTVGHALERLSDYEIRHGDAVAMGLVAASRLAVKLNMFKQADLDRVVDVLMAWKLPVWIPGAFSPEDILEALRTDKKRAGDTLHFILPVRIGEVVDSSDLDFGKLKEVLASLRGESKPDS